MTLYPSPINFNQAWHDCTAQDSSHRGDAAVDLAFWQEHAAGYDQNSRSPGRYENTLAAIRALVLPSDRLLDVGAGAGRFALPLAQSVQQVTALDHARPMLTILQQRAAEQKIENVTTIESAWEDAVVEPHDVVLAAWSLYRLPDMLTGMQKLIAATQRTLIIVAGVGHSIRHDPLLKRFWSDADRMETPMHTYYHGILWQAGAHADLKIVYEHHQLEGETPQAIAQQLAPDQASGHEIKSFAEQLAQQMVPTAGGWRYERSIPVGLLVWENSNKSTRKIF
ncbi:MAG: class I SAM-dependent methyltransferase [Chloroflexota bacterium]